MAKIWKKLELNKNRLKPISEENSTNFLQKFILLIQTAQVLAFRRSKGHLPTTTAIYNELDSLATGTRKYRERLISSQEAILRLLDEEHQDVDLHPKLTH